MRATYVLSYGGGVNTTALMVFLLRKRLPLDVAVFADTGAELPETYEYLKIAEESARALAHIYGVNLTAKERKCGNRLENPAIKISES